MVTASPIPLAELASYFCRRVTHHRGVISTFFQRDRETEERVTGRHGDGKKGDERKSDGRQTGRRETVRQRDREKER